MKPFCCNRKCVYHSHEVPDDAMSMRVQMPSGHDVELSRAAMVDHKRNLTFMYCEACENAIRQVHGIGEEAHASLGMQLQQPSSIILPN